MSFFVCLVLLHRTCTQTQSMTFQSKPEGRCLCVEWAFEFLSQCSYHCSLACTRQYVTIRVRNTCTRVKTGTGSLFYTHIPTILCLPSLLFCLVGKMTLASRWSLDVCVQFTIGRCLKMKPELYSFSFLFPEPHRSALTVSGFCSSCSHAIKNNGWSLSKLMRFTHKPWEQVLYLRSAVMCEQCV